MINGFLWRFLQNASTQIINFVISIYLARILDPSDYGLVAMIAIFITLASVFIDTGFSSAIIQKKEIDDVDLDTMFYSGFISSVVLYLILYIAAPYIAEFYHHEELILLLRIQGITVVIASLYSVQQALLTRELQFKKGFLPRVIGAIAHGIVGIILAKRGFGPLTLVYSAIANNVASAIVYWVIVKWKPGLHFSIKSFKEMFSFSARILSSSLLDTIFNNIRSLVIGRQYTSDDLAYYNRGDQFPTIIMSQIDGSISTVLFPTLSKYQDKWEEGLKLLRKSLQTSMYICLPLMFGLCAVAEPMIMFILTEKWAQSIEYVRLASIGCMFWPLTANNHALNALGKSKITLRLNTMSKIVSLTLLFLTYRHSVRLMIMSTLFSSIIYTIVSSIVYHYELNYKIKDQIMDLLPTLLLSLFMFVITYSISFLNLNYFVTLVLQVISGVIVYVIGSIVFKIDSFYNLLDIIKNRKGKKNAE